MARILTVGTIGPLQQLRTMLGSPGHTLSALASVTEARQYSAWDEHDVVLLGEKLTYGERELIAEIVRASASRAKLIFLYEFFIGNPQSADAIVDVALGFAYLPDAIHYVTRRQGSIRCSRASATGVAGRAIR